MENKPRTTFKERVFRDFDYLAALSVELYRFKKMEKIEETLRSLSGEGEIREQIIEPNCGHGYDHFGDIATTLSLTYDRLELTDTYQNDVCPEEFCKTVVEGVEQIAKLVDCTMIDLKDKDNLLDNLFQALTDYSGARGFHCGADFIPLFNELKIKYTEK